METETAVLCLQTKGRKDRQPTPELERGLDFWPPELRDNKLFKPPRGVLG